MFKHCHFVLYVFVFVKKKKKKKKKNHIYFTIFVDGKLDFDCIFLFIYDRILFPPVLIMSTNLCWKTKNHVIRSSIKFLIHIMFELKEANMKVTLSSLEDT